MTDRFDEMAGKWCGEEFHRWVDADTDRLDATRLAALLRRVHNEAIEQAACRASCFANLNHPVWINIRALKIEAAKDAARKETRGG
jgi:hypothetical protein